MSKNVMASRMRASAWMSMIVVLLITLPAPIVNGGGDQASVGDASSAAWSLDMDRQFFVPNEGQWADASVVYGLHANKWSIGFKQSEICLTLRQGQSVTSRDHEGALHDHSIEETPLPDGRGSYGYVSDATQLTLTFPHSNAVEPIGIDATTTTVNYYVGGEGRAPASNLATFKTIVYPNLYDGIDLHVKCDDSTGTLKYEFHLAPGIDHTQIQMQYDGLDCPLWVDANGALNIDTRLGTLLDHAPVSYQLVDGKRHNIAAEYELYDDHIAAFTLSGKSDPSRPLVIDPEVEWMRYYGGSDDDIGGAVVENADGNLLLAGDAHSLDFDGRTNEHHGSDDTDVFLCELTSTGEIVWMTYLGGTGWELVTDSGNGLAIDSVGNAVLAGYTTSDDFDGRTNEYYGNQDAFICKVSEDGILQWMTYYGGSDIDLGYAMTLDTEDHVLVTGLTGSEDFEGHINEYHNHREAFVLKVGPSGGISWAIFLGGTNWEYGFGIETDATGNAIVTGSTFSSDFEGRLNSWHGNEDGFICKVTPAGLLEWMIYVGGSGDDYPSDVRVDHTGTILICGSTNSSDFEGRLNEHHGGERDAFALNVFQTGQVDWMTYLGGSSNDFARALTLSTGDDILISGLTKSTDVEGRLNAYYGGAYDGCLFKSSLSGDLQWMMYIGGSDDDRALSIEMNGDGHALIAGETNSGDFARRINNHHAMRDAFVIEVDTTNVTSCLSLAHSGLVAGQEATWTVAGATSGERVAIVYGLQDGETNLNGFGGYCASFGIRNVNPNRVIGQPVADENGVATVTRRVPAGTSGVRVLMQAAERGTCPEQCVSNLLDEVIG